MAVTNPSIATHGKANDDVNTGNINALGGTVSLHFTQANSSWSVQVGGVFVGTLTVELTVNGSDWQPVNFRQTKAGRSANSFSNIDVAKGSLFRGSAGGCMAMRVRATSWTSGVANVALQASPASGAMFLNSFVESRSLLQYYASTSGSNVAYNVTCGVVGVGTAGLNVLAFENPMNSGTDLYIAKIFLSNENAGRFERYRNGTFTNRGTALTEVNRGGNTSTSLGKAYSAPNGLSISNGTLGKVEYVSTNDAESDFIDGSIILRPGQNQYWRYVPNSGLSSNCSVEVVWWETAAVT